MLYSQDACTYDLCAMRVELGRIVVGQHGMQSYKLAPFSTPRLESRLATSDSARAYYTVFEDNHVPGNVWTLVGGLAMGFALAASSDPEWLSSEYTLGITIVGGIATLIGSRKVRKAQNALARSIWWYNRDLPR